ncbi:MAG: ADP-ribosylglycohydrolase family protein, partial [Thermomicrobiales bacterium]
MPKATEDRFLGAMMGLAIGDALGMPFVGMSRGQIAKEAGPILAFHPLVDPVNGDVDAGEVTDETEAALALSEAMTTSGG